MSGSPSMLASQKQTHAFQSMDNTAPSSSPPTPPSIMSQPVIDLLSRIPQLMFALQRVQEADISSGDTTLPSTPAQSSQNSSTFFAKIKQSFEQLHAAFETETGITVGFVEKPLPPNFDFDEAALLIVEWFEKLPSAFAVLRVLKEGQPLLKKAFEDTETNVLLFIPFIEQLCRRHDDALKSLTHEQGDAASDSGVEVSLGSDGSGQHGGQTGQISRTNGPHEPGNAASDPVADLSDTEIDKGQHHAGLTIATRGERDYAAVILACIDRAVNALVPSPPVMAATTSSYHDVMQDGNHLVPDAINPDASTSTQPALDTAAVKRPRSGTEDEDSSKRTRLKPHPVQAVERRLAAAELDRIKWAEFQEQSDDASISSPMGAWQDDTPLEEDGDDDKTEEALSNDNVFSETAPLSEALETAALLIAQYNVSVTDTLPSFASQQILESVTGAAESPSNATEDAYEWLSLAAHPCAEETAQDDPYPSTQGDEDWNGEALSNDIVISENASLSEASETAAPLIAQYTVSVTDTLPSFASQQTLESVTGAAESPSVTAEDAYEWLSLAAHTVADTAETAQDNSTSSPASLSEFLVMYEDMIEPSMEDSYPEGSLTVEASSDRSSDVEPNAFVEDEAISACEESWATTGTTSASAANIAEDVGADCLDTECAAHGSASGWYPNFDTLPDASSQDLGLALDLADIFGADDNGAAGAVPTISEVSATEYSPTPFAPSPEMTAPTAPRQGRAYALHACETESQSTPRKKEALVDNSNAAQAPVDHPDGSIACGSGNNAPASTQAAVHSASSIARTVSSRRFVLTGYWARELSRQAP